MNWGVYLLFLQQVCHLFKNKQFYSYHFYMICTNGYIRNTRNMENGQVRNIELCNCLEIILLRNQHYMIIFTHSSNSFIFSGEAPATRWWHGH